MDHLVLTPDSTTSTDVQDGHVALIRDLIKSKEIQAEKYEKLKRSLTNVDNRAFKNSSQFNCLLDSTSVCSDESKPISSGFAMPTEQQRSLAYFDQQEETSLEFAHHLFSLFDRLIMDIDTPAYRIGLLSRYRVRSHIYHARSREIDQLKSLYGSQAQVEIHEIIHAELAGHSMALDHDDNTTIGRKRRRARSQSPDDTLSDCHKNFRTHRLSSQATYAKSFLPDPDATLTDTYAQQQQQISIARYGQSSLQPHNNHPSLTGRHSENHTKTNAQPSSRRHSAAYYPAASLHATSGDPATAGEPQIDQNQSSSDLMHPQIPDNGDLHRVHNPSVADRTPYGGGSWGFENHRASSFRGPTRFAGLAFSEARTMFCPPGSGTTHDAQMGKGGTDSKIDKENQLHEQQNRHPQLSESISSAQQEVRRVRSEHGSPEPGALRSNEMYAGFPLYLQDLSLPAGLSLPTTDGPAMDLPQLNRVRHEGDSSIQGGAATPTAVQAPLAPPSAHNDPKQSKGETDVDNPIPLPTTPKVTEMREKHDFQLPSIRGTDSLSRWKNDPSDPWTPPMNQGSAPIYAQRTPSGQMYGHYHESFRSKVTASTNSHYRLNSGYDDSRDMNSDMSADHPDQSQGGQSIAENRKKIVYRCAAPDCKNPDELWPRLENFRQHCHRIHGDLDCEELVRKSQLDAEESGSIIAVKNDGMPCMQKRQRIESKVPERPVSTDPTQKALEELIALWTPIATA